jgi:hypothetical protein
MSFKKKIKGYFKNVVIYIAISRRYIINVVLGIMEKTHRLVLRNIIKIQIYNWYIYSRTKIEREFYSDCVNSFCLYSARGLERENKQCADVLLSFSVQ